MKNGTKPIAVLLPPAVKARVSKHARVNGKTAEEAITQLVDEALTHMQRKHSLARFRKGKLTIRKLAERLGLTYLETNDLLAEEGIALIR